MIIDNMSQLNTNNKGDMLAPLLFVKYAVVPVPNYQSKLLDERYVFLVYNHIAFL